MKIAILGYGVEGKSVERFFSKDPSNEIKIFESISKEEAAAMDFSEFDLVFRAPSLHPQPRDNWTSATRYFFQHCPAPIIGVTGTKGKGTTCSFTAAILKATGKTVHFLGNVGVPSLDILPEIKPDDVVVYEMSSFQLWDLEKSPHISVVLRIEPDHLDVHDGFEDYVNAKANIVRHQTADDYCIYYKDNADSVRISEKAGGKRLTYPYAETAELDEILDNIQIPGAHNRENAEAAILAAACYYNLSVEEFIAQYRDQIKAGVASFKGLPHHIEYVTEIDGIKYYDDSFASTYPAMEVAVRAFPNDRVILIAGGKNRHLNLEGVRQVIANEKNLLKTILIGETKQILAEGQDPARVELADTFEEAFDKANAAAKELGANIVMLSPGAASFDMFKNFKERGEIFQRMVKRKAKNYFEFVGYEFDAETNIATFNYRDKSAYDFSEKIEFSRDNLAKNVDQDVLDCALKLCFLLIGTSYYKAHPTKQVLLPVGFQLDEFQAEFLNKVYQEGLSQYAFENQLTRDDLAHFEATTREVLPAPNYDGRGIVAMQSGGKDSLLVAEMLNEKALEFTPLYITSSETHPAVLDQLGAPLTTIRRHVDINGLKAVGGLNGHVPITYIIESLALVQAILMNKNTVLASIGQEGNEAHAHIGDLAVNHQWSKTWPAEQAIAEYVKREISPDLKVGSPIRAYSELKIAELFIKKCFAKYGHMFSSCNVANYRQQASNETLSWCGECAKCANSFILFSPFLPPEELKAIFNGKDLFAEPKLENDFKGLLGVGGVIKPFECVGETGELQAAYAMRQPGYSDLPFTVPTSNFDYEKVYPHQDLI